MNITPKQLYLKYRNLSVTTVTGELVRGIDVHEYRTNDSGVSADLQCTAGCQEFSGPLMKAIRKKGTLHAGGYELAFEVSPPAWTIGFDAFRRTRQACVLGVDDDMQWIIKEVAKPQEMQACFLGKGSPELIAQVLRIAEALGRFTKPLGPAMQTFCDKFIGVDCSGFVSQYLNANGAEIDAVNGAPCLGFYLPKAKLNNRKTANDIRAGDVMAFATTNHVTAIESVSKTSVAPIPRDLIPMEPGMCEDPMSNLPGASKFTSFRMPKEFYQEKFVTELEVVESCGAQLVKGNIHTDGLNCTKYTVVSQNKNGSYQVKRQQLDQSSFTVWIAAPESFT